MIFLTEEHIATRKKGGREGTYDMAMWSGQQEDDKCSETTR
jgi:hypothetical protein